MSIAQKIQELDLKANRKDVINKINELVKMHNIINRTI